MSICTKRVDYLSKVLRNIIIYIFGVPTSHRCNVCETFVNII